MSAVTGAINQTHKTVTSLKGNQKVLWDLEIPALFAGKKDI